jgi:hypothetical protein
MSSQEHVSKYVPSRLQDTGVLPSLSGERSILGVPLQHVNHEETSGLERPRAAAALADALPRTRPAQQAILRLTI